MGDELSNYGEYLQSVMEESSVSDGHAEAADRFFNETQPQYGILHEHPKHRMMIILKVKGFSNKKIAEALDTSAVSVCNVLRQPWARERMLKMLSEEGEDNAMRFLASEEMNNLFTLVDLRDDTATPKIVRANAANSLLDRLRGKPTQRIESEATIHHTHDDIAAVNKEIEELEREEKRLVGARLEPAGLN